MIRISVVTRFCLGSMLIATFSTSSLAQPNDHSDALSQLIRRGYPALSIVGGLACKNAIRIDNAISKFCDHLVLSGLFAAADETASALVENDVIESKRDAHTFTAIPTLAIGYALGNPSQDTLAKTTTASGANQFGRAYREYIKDQPSKTPDVLKGTGAAVALATLAAANSGRNPTTFAEKASISGVYTFAYVLRESAIDVIRGVSSHLPELKVAAIFSAVGAVGMTITQPFQMPYFVSSALLEAGAFTAADEAIKAAPSVGLYPNTAKYLTALLGAALYIPSAKANTATRQVVANVGQALLLPAAFSLTYEALKSLANQLSPQS